MDLTLVAMAASWVRSQQFNSSQETPSIFALARALAGTIGQQSVVTVEPVAPALDPEGKSACS